MKTVTDTNNKKNIAVFLHGYATSPTDLDQLADSFKEAGFETLNPWLPFHPLDTGVVAEQDAFSLDKTKNEIIASIQSIDSDTYDIYLVGFSLGGALAVDIAAEVNLAGVLAISPFFESTYRKITNTYLSIRGMTPSFKIKRRFQTTTKGSRKYLAHEAPSLPVQATIEVAKNAEKLENRVSLSRCPILLVHSLDDKISSFSATARVVRASAREDIRLVPIHGLNHFIQFDIAPHTLRDIALEYFSPSESMTESETEILSVVINESWQESRHWSGIIFQLIVGFFTLFGALLAFTLPDVLQASWGEADGQEIVKSLSGGELQKHHKAVAGAPYYLIGYSFVISIYIILLSLYFFYMNRIDSFIRVHVEPLYNFAPWMQYRTRAEATGKTSSIITNAVSIPTVLIPIFASISLLVALPFIFPDRIFVWELRNAFLHSFYFSSVILSLYSVWSLFLLKFHASSVTYGISAPIKTSSGMELAIRRLYASINKGAYGRVRDN